MNLDDLTKIKPGCLGLARKCMLREAYIDMLSKQPTRYHLTVTFKYGVKENVAVGLLNIFLKYLNRAILKGRYEKKGEFIKGFAIKESTPSMENVHFHIALSDFEWLLPCKDKMEVIIKKKMASANNSAKLDNRMNKFQLQNYVKGSEVSNLGSYLTKNFENNSMSMEKKVDSICPLGHEGVSFGI